MTLPEDRAAEAAHAIKLLTRREARAMSRIRSALRTLADVRKKLARERKAYDTAVRDAAAKP